jgi:hypothetical protein
MVARVGRERDGDGDRTDDGGEIFKVEGEYCGPFDR